MTDIDILLDLLIFVAVLLHKLVPEGLHRLPGLLVPPLHHGLQADPHHGVSLVERLEHGQLNWALTCPASWSRTGHSVSSLHSVRGISCCSVKLTILSFLSRC